MDTLVNEVFRTQIDMTGREPVYSTWQSKSQKSLTENTKNHQGKTPNNLHKDKPVRITAVKRQPREWENVFASYSSDRGTNIYNI